MPSHVFLPIRLPLFLTLKKKNPMQKINSGSTSVQFWVGRPSMTSPSYFNKHRFSLLFNSTYQLNKYLLSNHSARARCSDGRGWGAGMWESKPQAPVSNKPEIRHGSSTHVRPSVDSTQASKTHGDPTAHFGVPAGVCWPGVCTGVGRAPPGGFNTFGPVMLPASRLPLKQDP